MAQLVRAPAYRAGDPGSNPVLALIQEYRPKALSKKQLKAEEGRDK